MKIIFTDLDGTLLDKCDFAPAKGTIGKLNRLAVPIIIVSSKTAPEIIQWQKKLGIGGPFACENGAAIYAPKGFFPKNMQVKERGNMQMLPLAKKIRTARALLSSLRVKGVETLSLCAMPVSSAMKASGLDCSMALMARGREFDECFKIVSGSRERIQKEAESAGFRFFSGGKFSHLCSSDKGKALRAIRKILAGKLGRIHCIAIGDGENDMPMLRAADTGYLLGGKKAQLDPHIKTESGKGPKVWVKVIEAEFGLH
ncbi:MAG TPA: HAD-IIB family hydrolase [Candidatus Diapherotrites archaeon]|uniref:HAD-IIB family hydrolase n=1 Tax=Candidatus Iainarchaeum sp. TaxID=3101447 RepID=A0A7J4IWQ6_9ARCH|nr:HAD-IIB family hydrolase [Candidatus Diapherotrites archaeon]